jgi:hypothetical protein
LSWTWWAEEGTQALFHFFPCKTENKKTQKKRRRKKRRTTLLDISPKNPVIIRQLPISLASWKKNETEKEKRTRERLCSGVISLPGLRTSSAPHAIQPWPRVGCFYVVVLLRPEEEPALWV